MKNPAQNIESDEFQHAFLSFCTFVSLLNGKKMNYPTVFLKILEITKDLLIQQHFMAIG